MMPGTAGRHTRSAVLLCVVITGAAIMRGEAESARQSHDAFTVAIDGTEFVPATLSVRVGDRITWVNRDPFPHTVTARNGRFDSKLIAAGASWTYRATKKGEFPYTCTLHPTMKGTVVVR
jgi:plastocyanin